MTKDVLVSVKGVQTIGEETDTIEIITSGTWYEKNGKQYLLYEETYEETNQTTKNTVKITPTQLEVTKRGMVDSRMIYERGQKHVSNYMTPMGLILLGITTKDMTVEMEEDRFHASIHYGLEMNGEFVSDNVLEIQVSVKNGNTFNLN